MTSGGIGTFQIMLPFWGSFDHFKVAVQSVLAQTDPDWTLTVVDDRYPDTAPGEWVVSLGDPRITYLRNEVNLGVSRNYIACVAMMTGEYSMLFGCDDVMLPDFVATVRRLIEQNPDASVVQPGVEVVDSDGTVYLPLADRVKRRYRFAGTGVRSFGGEVLATNLLKGNWTYFPSLVWRVELLKRYGFDPDLNVVQDLGMLLDIAAGGGSLVVDDTVVFQYRRHKSSVSSATAVDGSRFKQERELFDREASRFTAIGWTKAAQAARRHNSSRLNAVTKIPTALIAGDWGGVKALTRHATGRHID